MTTTPPRDPEAPPSDRTRVRRASRRGAYDRETLYGILDEGLVCHLGFSGEDGQPYVIPTGYGRDGDRLILHGSVASRAMKRAAEGVPVCVTVTLVDGLVLARSTFHHSMNYRSVMILGTARPIEDPEDKARALEVLVEHLVPGRSAEAREGNAKELAATSVLAVDLTEASAKVRSGPPVDDRRDVELPVWAGVIPLALAPGAPEPAPDLGEGIGIPEYVRDYRRIDDR